MSGRRGAVVLGVVLLVAVVVGVVLTGRVESVPPFDIDSARPNGMEAVRLLLDERGVRVERAPAADLVAGTVASGPGDAVVAMVPSVATADELAALERLAEGGTTVVLGEPLPDEGAGAADELVFSPLDEAAFLTDRTLADTPALPADPGECDVAELADLGDLDVAFAAPMALDGDRRCWADPGGTYLTERAVGAGRVVTLASPFLWVNARLQPDKEDGGAPLANGPAAIRLLGDADTVTFIDPVPSPDAVRTGSQDVWSLLPLPVQLALAQLLGALVIFLWWRSRRLGRPVEERLPVEIAGSELVVAVGDLLRRRGNAERAAATVRGETRRVLAERLGTGPEPTPAALVSLVAARTGREPADVAAALYDDPSRPITSPDALVGLVRTLDTIRQEVLHVVPQ